MSHAEGNSGLTAFVFTVNRAGATDTSSGVSWAVQGLGGSNVVNGADFQGGALPYGNLGFAPGETSKTITVNVVGDTTSEPTETFRIVMHDANGAVIPSTGADAFGTISDDDGSTPPPSGGQVINSPGPSSTLTGGAGADTLNASQGPDQLTGGGGADHFAWAQLPWNAGHVTDFALGVDKLDLRALFQASGYAGSNPIADGRLEFRPDGQGNTQVYFDRDALGGGDWPFLITTLDGVQPGQLGSGDWLFR